jgi:K+/H+ antiporter YhaU regulatory subunit KhtT
LDERIIASGLTESEFLRDFILKNRTTVVAKPKASLEKKRLQFVFNKTSNDLNEIAHVLNMANQTHRLTDQLFRQAVQGLQEVAQYLKAALDHVD